MIVVVQKEEQTVLVHDFTLGKGERLAHEPRQALTQRIVPALNVIGLTTVFTTSTMLLLGQHLAVTVPEVAIQQTMTIAQGDALPEQTTGLGTAVTHGVGHNLPRAAAQS